MPADVSFQPERVPFAVDPVLVVVQEDMTAKERAAALQEVLHPTGAAPDQVLVRRPLWIVSVARRLLTERTTPERGPRNRRFVLGMWLLLVISCAAMIVVPLGLTWIPFLPLVASVTSLLGEWVGRRPVPRVLVKPMFFVGVVLPVLGVAVARHLMGTA